jgi:LPXTG-motif cell wall-anchored protein
MRLSRLFLRGVCIVCGVVGFGILILAATRNGWLVWLGVACLLVGLVAASFVKRR